jgi:fluoroquinolone transport system permease protein
MTALLTALRWDVVVQARNGFYWATLVLVLIIGGLLVTIPETARANAAVWVPALLAVNLQITTFFFVAGLILLERDEGSLAALAVLPITAGDYLAIRTVTLTGLAAAETLVVVWLGSGTGGNWFVIMSGIVVLGIVYTGFGAAVGSRYSSVNTLLLPASLIVTMLLLPLLAHFGMASRAIFFLHPIEPALTLIRAGYGVGDPADMAFGVIGSALWCVVAFVCGRTGIARLMRDTRASGGR